MGSQQTQSMQNNNSDSRNIQEPSQVSDTISKLNNPDVDNRELLEIAHQMNASVNKVFVRQVTKDL